MDRPTIAAVIEAVAAREADFGVVPIENSTEGGVTSTLDALLESPARVRGELVLDIAQCLASKARSLAEIERVYSHPQGLAQCRRWLAAAPTARRGRALRLDERRGAEGGDRAAFCGDRQRARGRALRARPCRSRARQQRQRHALRDPRARGRADVAGDKTSLVFSTLHERGALRRALEVFDDENINLTRIESRPARGRRWEYVFFTDLEGHRLDEPVQRALSAWGPSARESRCSAATRAQNEFLFIFGNLHLPTWAGVSSSWITSPGPLYRFQRGGRRSGVQTRAIR